MKQRSLGQRYTLHAVLGRGGMGTVYQATDQHLGRAVALKIAHPGPAASARLRREARVLGALQIAGIPPLLDAGEHDAVPFLVLPLLRGDTLAATPAPLPQRLHALGHTAEALAAAHAAGVVHRDLKPQNLLVDDRGTIWALDWGLARLLPESTVDPGGETDPWLAALSTAEGTLLGSPAYMSPEQITDAAVGPAADVWSLGVILWEQLSGRRAYPGTHKAEVLRRVLAAPPPPLVDAPASQRHLADLVSACTGPAASRPSMAELGAALRAPAPAPPHRRRARRGTAGALALGGLALAAWVARAPPAPTDDPAVLAEAAEWAWKTGDRPRAEQLAVRALRAGADPATRGLLLRTQPRPVLTLHQQLRCGIGEELSFDGSLVLCAQPGHTVAWRLGEHALEEQWRQEVEVHLIKLVGDDLLLVQSGDGSGAFMLDLQTGAPLSSPIPELRRSGRLSSSRASGRFWGEGPTGWFTATRSLAGAFSVAPLPAPPCRGNRTVDPLGRELVGCTHRLLRLEDGAWRAVVTHPLDQPGFARWAWNGPLYMATDTDHQLMAFDSRDDSFTTDVGAWTGSGAGGARVASQSHGHRISVGRIGQARELWQTVSGHSAHRRLTPDDELVIMGNGEVARWSLPPDPPRHAWSAGGTVKALAWADAGLLALRHDGVLRVWDSGGQPLAALDGVRAFARRGEALALARDEDVALWDPASGLRVLAPELRCQVLVWLGASLACGPLGPGPLLVDTTSGAVDRSAVLPDSTWFAGDSTGAVAVLMEWSTRLFRIDAQRPGELVPLLRDAEARALSVSPDGRWYATDQRRQLMLRSLVDDQTRILARGEYRATPLAWSADAARLAAVDLDGTVHIWAADSGTRLARIPPTAEGPAAVAFSPDGRYLAKALPSGLIVALDLRPLEQDVDTLWQEVAAAWGPP